MTGTIHLHPTAELAPRVLLPGDPGRALLLAQVLLEAPLMFNHNRGLWGYTGTAADGAPLTDAEHGHGRRRARRSSSPSSPTSGPSASCGSAPAGR